MTRVRLGILTAFMALVLPFVTMTGVASAAPSQGLHPGDEYVALGDSFASGSGVAPLSDVLCGRSAVDYPHLIAQQLHLTLKDVTCGGAITDNILNTPQYGFVPLQINAVTPNTKLVTITVGGNDGNYLLSLVQMSCAHDPAPVANTPNLPPELQALLCGTVDRAANLQTLSGINSKLEQLVAAIRLRAPAARIVLTDYGSVLPQSGNPCSGLLLTKDEIKFGLKMENIFSRSVKHAAQASGVDYVRLSEISKHHDVCSDDPWVNGYVFADFAQYGLLVYHPNAEGIHAAAGAIISELQHDCK